MPQVLGAVIPAFAAGGSFALVTSTGALTALGIGVNVAATLALSALQRPGGSFGGAPKPQPNTVQFNLREPVGARIRHYGEVLVGGTIVFFRVSGGTLYRVVVHGHGEIAEIAAVYIVRQQVTLDGAGVVQEAQYDVAGSKRLTILTRTGAASQAAFSEIGAVWSEYDADHRLDGLVASLTIAEQVPAENSLATYPDPDLAIQLQLKASKVYDPRTGLTAWSDNAALVVADFVTHPDGMGLAGLVDLTALEAEADESDELVPLAAGGTERRWRIAGSYSLAEAPTSVLTRMLDACAGSLVLTPRGKLEVRVGRWVPPTLVLETADILEITRLDDGPDVTERYTELPFTYVDPDLSFQQVTGDPWSDADLEARYGAREIGPLLDLDMAPSHGQGRRAAKIRVAADNPARILELRCQPWALAAAYERTVELDVPEVAGLSGAWWVRSYSLDLNDRAVTLRLERADPDAFLWSSAEEGQAQTLPAAAESGIIPTPTGFAAAGYGASTGIRAAWVAPAGDTYAPRLEYSVAGADSWTVLSLAVGDVNEQIGGLSGDYDVRLAFVAGEQIGPYARIDGITAAATTAVPAAATSLTATNLGSGEARVAFTTSASATLWKTEVRRNGTLIATLYADAGEAVALTDAPGAGSYSYTVRSIDVAGAQNTADAGPAAVIVTS